MGSLLMAQCVPANWLCVCFQPPETMKRIRLSLLTSHMPRQTQCSPPSAALQSESSSQTHQPGRGGRKDVCEQGFVSPQHHAAGIFKPFLSTLCLESLLFAVTHTFSTQQPYTHTHSHSGSLSHLPEGREERQRRRRRMEDGGGGCSGREREERKKT